jgi:DNA-binding transcriptional MerR regulator
MRQLDLFQPVEIAKPQSNATTSKVNGEVPAMPVQPAKNGVGLSEQTKPVAIKEEQKKEVKEEHKNQKEHHEQKELKINGKRGRKSFKEMDADIVMVEVPDDEILFHKKYYAISEVAQWFHVNASLLRFWENEFDILKPRKTRKGDRLFRPEDVKNLQLIYFLLRQRKFSIEGAKQYLKENKKKADVQMQLIQSLTKFRAFLLEWKANLGA